MSFKSFPTFILRFVLTCSIKLYRMCLSPLLPATCRYQPTCSTYALEAIEVYGPLKGCYISLKRIARCHPWGSHGYDPITNAQVKKVKKKDEN